jgi:hypothetical protein
VSGHSISERLAINDAAIAAMEARYDCARDEDGLTRLDYDEIFGACAAIERQQEGRALAALWRGDPPRQPGRHSTHGTSEVLQSHWGWPTWLQGIRRFAIRLWITTLILRGRWGEPCGDPYGAEVCWWDYRHDGYFWSCWSLRLHKGGRVSVGSDGDGESPY